MDTQVETAARHLLAAHRAGARYAPLPGELRPTTLAVAYAIQDEFRRLLEPERGAVCGYKIALTSPVMQKLCGIPHPLSGPLYARSTHASPARLESGAFAKGYFHEPTVFTDVDPKMRVAKEEIFGPVVSVIPCRSLEEAIAIGNDVEYGLSASIYTQDINRAFTAMRDLYTGIFYVNAPTIGAEVHLPFGGTKDTGNGHREAGQAALDVFTEWKSIYVDYSGRLQRAQIDNVD